MVKYAEMTREEIESKLKDVIVSSLDLEDLTAADIATDVPLFGEGLGLDSIDALELGMAVKKAFGRFSTRSRHWPTSLNNRTRPTRHDK